MILSLQYFSIAKPAITYLLKVDFFHFLVAKYEDKDSPGLNVSSAKSCSYLCHVHQNI